MTMTNANDWMLNDVVSVPYVRHAVVLSSDGLVTAQSQDTDTEVAERLAAACSAMQSLGRSMAKEFGSGGKGVRHQMIEFDGGFLFLRRAGNGSHLAVVTDAMVDPALIAQQMQAQVNKIGAQNLATASRQDAGT